MSTTPMSLEQFGQTIKAKHPEYSDMADADVGQKVLAKYPQYSDMVQPAQKNPVAPPSQAQLATLRANINSPQGGATTAQPSGLQSILQKFSNSPVGDALTSYPAQNASDIGQRISDNLNPKNIAESLSQQGQQVAHEYTSGNMLTRIPRGLVAPLKAVNPANLIDSNSLTGTAGNVATAALLAGSAPEGSVPNPRTPSASAAGEAMNAVKSAAGDIPIDLGKVGDVALRTKDLAATGGRMPKVINDFIKRTTDPTKGPLTYAEAQDFYSNATRLSAGEFQQLTPVMQRQVAAFTDSLAKSMKGAADQVGMGNQLVEGKAEYSSAMKQRAAIDYMKQALVKKIIPYGAGAYVADRILRK